MDHGHKELYKVIMQGLDITFTKKSKAMMTAIEEVFALGTMEINAKK